MRFGYRKPSLKRSLRARTTGRYTRKAKSLINPYYGKKGVGLAKNPHRAIYNKVYHKTTKSVFDDLEPLHKETMPTATTRKNRGRNKKKEVDDTGTGLGAFLACIWILSAAWGFNWILLIPLTIIIIFLIIAMRKGN